MDDALFRIRRIASTQAWVVSLEQALGAGMTVADVRAQVRRRRWSVLVGSVYLVDTDSYADALPQRAWWWAALLGHGPGAHLVAGSGARALGLHGLPSDEAVVEVGLSHHMPRAVRREPGLDGAGPLIVVRQLPPSDDVVIVDGLPVRHPRYTVVDAAIGLDRPSALSVMDSALHRAVLSYDDLAVAMAGAKGRRGIEQLRKVFDHVDARAESVVESRLRLCCIDQGVPPDDLQHIVRDGLGHVVAIGDLGWHERRRRPLLAEADGLSIHDRLPAVFRDRTRGNALAGEACDTLRFTFADTLRPCYVGYVVRRALAAG